MQPLVSTVAADSTEILPTKLRSQPSKIDEESDEDETLNDLVHSPDDQLGDEEQLGLPESQLVQDEIAEFEVGETGLEDRGEGQGHHKQEAGEADQNHEENQEGNEPD